MEYQRKASFQDQIVGSVIFIAYQDVLRLRTQKWKETYVPRYEPLFSIIAWAKIERVWDTASPNERLVTCYGMAASEVEAPFHFSSICGCACAMQRMHDTGNWRLTWQEANARRIEGCSSELRGTYYCTNAREMKIENYYVGSLHYETDDKTTNKT